MFVSFELRGFEGDVSLSSPGFVILASLESERLKARAFACAQKLWSEEEMIVNFVYLKSILM